MSSLLLKLTDIKKDAARVLEDAGISFDVDIQTLNHIDFNELFPGRENLKSRKMIFKTVQEHQTKHELQGKVNNFTPGESLSDTVGTNDAMETGTSSACGTVTSTVDSSSCVRSQVMSSLLLAIKNFNEKAALELENEGFCSDADLKTLTRQDLNELFPGPEDFKLRKWIFDTIQKHEPNYELFEEENKFPPEATFGGTSNTASVVQDKRDDGHLQREHDTVGTNDAMETGTSSACGTVTSTVDSSSCVRSQVMSSLLLAIKNFNKEAALELENEGFCSDADLKTLTRQDLNELFPGPGNFKLRKWILDTIQRHEPNYELFEEEDKFPPEATFGGTSNTASVVQDKRDDGHLQREHDTGHAEKSFFGEIASSISNKLNLSRFLTELLPKDVKYKKVVSGETFGADQDFMEKVKAQLHGVVQLTESRENQQITILFCPITSRVGSDVQAAMSEVKDDKPIILVLMHHSRTPKVTTSVRTWDLDANYTKIIFHAEVFYHDTVGGLLKCQENDVAVSQIRNQLLEYCPERTANNSGRSYTAMGGKSGRGGNTSDTDDAMETESFTELFSFDVKYKKVVSGETFGADQDFMGKVKAQLQDLVWLTEGRDNHQITILFCPITSRVGSDVEAAMSHVTDDKPIILVLMHHSRAPKVTTSVRTWDLDASCAQIIFHVDVFFHDTVNGLLKCQQNDAAVSQIQKKLQVLFAPRSEIISGQSNQVVDAKRARTNGKDGNKKNHSDENSKGPRKQLVHNQK